MTDHPLFRRRTWALVAAFILLVVLLVGVDGPADARIDDPGDRTLIEPVPATASDRGETEVVDPTERRVRIDTDVLDHRGPTRVDAVLGDEPVRLDLRPVRSGTDDANTWVGSVVGDELSSVTIVERDGTVTGAVFTRRGGHHVRAGADGLGIVRPMTSGGTESADDVIPAPTTVPPTDPVHPDAPGTTGDAHPPMAAAPSTPVIRVLIAYTPLGSSRALADAAPGRSESQARQDFATLLVDSVNTIYEQSGVVGRIELAGVTTTSHELAPTEPDLLDLATGARGASIKAERETTEADLVSVISQPPGGGNCGLAFLNTSTDVEAAARWGFSAVRYDCALDNLTFAHELGHNQGLGHDHHVGGDPPFRPYAYGWSEPAEGWYTIQSYSNRCNLESPPAVTCSRIPRVSNPDRNWTTGSPLGSPWPSPTPADAALALNQYQPYVASFRGPIFNPAAECDTGSDWPCPFTSWERLVNQQWADFGRSGSSTERLAAVIDLETGRTNAGEYIAGLLLDTRLGFVRDRVSRLYLAYFLRPPDRDGMDFWVDRYETKPNITSIAAFFARSGEFGARYGSLDNGGFVDLVYQNTLGRAPDPAGRAFWKARLDSGSWTRARVMVGFADSPEFRTRRSIDLDVILTYRGMLDRPPTTAEFTNDVDWIRSGGVGIESVIHALSQRPDYFHRVTR